MTGKQKCNLLRQIRRDIAAANDIPYRERDCTHTGVCSGTCPYCEAELRRLEVALAERRSLGKRIAVMGLSMGLLAVNLSSCDNPFRQTTQLQGDMVAPDTTGTEQIVEATDHIPGELVEATTTTEPPVIEGEMTVEPLMGDPVPPETEATMGVPPLPETDLPEPDEDAAVTTEPYVESDVLMGTMPVPETTSSTP